jgi:dehydrogenase/reductase SDR family member 12
LTTIRQTTCSRALDRSLDLAVAPGYSRLGYRLRGLRWTNAIAGSLRDQTALVTGGTSGIGEAAAEGLLLAGATVHLLGRDPGRTREAVRKLGSRVPGAEDRLHPETCDLSELADVRRFSESFLARHGRLDVLVNNAGVLPPSRQQTSEGVELTFATNVLGPFLLTSLLLPALAATESPRVITVASGGMYTARLRADDLELRRESYDGSRAYAHTKRIEVILNRLWAEHHGSDGFLFHSMHPGWVATPGLRRSLPRFERLMRPALRSPRQGADTIVWLATAPLPRSAGGAFWHDRVRRPEHRLPGTRETESERRLLWDSCERLSALSTQASRSAAAV